jgi:hypothetical protein
MGRAGEERTNDHPSPERRLDLRGLDLLMLGFSGVGSAAFSIAERFGRRTAAEWRQ